jgi:hypothetical protein
MDFIKFSLIPIHSSLCPQSFNKNNKRNINISLHYYSCWNLLQPSLFVVVVFSLLLLLLLVIQQQQQLFFPIPNLSYMGVLSYFFLLNNLIMAHCCTCCSILYLCLLVYEPNFIKASLFYLLQTIKQSNR